MEELEGGQDECIQCGLLAICEIVTKCDLFVRLRGHTFSVLLCYSA